MIRARLSIASVASAALLCSFTGIAAAASQPGHIVVAQRAGEGPKPGAAARGIGGGRPAVSGAVRTGGNSPAGRAMSTEGRRVGGDARAPRAPRVHDGERARTVVREGRREGRPDRVIVDRNDRRGSVDRRHRRGEGRPWRSGRRYSWGPGIYFYFYDGYYYGDCSWLRAKARATGSSYWWHRYRHCREAW